MVETRVTFQRVEIGDCVLIHGDSRLILPTMADASVDHVITDPPYAEKTHAGARGARPGVSLTTVPLVDFESIDDEEFLSLAGHCVRLARRWALMTCDWRHSAAAFRSGLPVVRCGVWVKPDAAPQFTGDRPGTGWEAVLILHREGRKRWNGGGHHATWIHPVERNNVHPTQKPLRLVNQWVKLFTDPGETILDPYMGSATTLVAAIQCGRKAIGIEWNREHFDRACRRVEDAVGIGSLFQEDAAAETANLFPDAPTCDGAVGSSLPDEPASNADCGARHEKRPDEAA